MTRPTIDTLQRGRRREILELFRRAGRPLTAREVANATGLHINTARFHIDTLVRGGTLRRQDGRATGRGRPASQYALVPGMGGGGKRNYKLLAQMLLSHLALQPDARATAVRAGKVWGRQLAAPVASGRRVSAAKGLQRLTQVLAEVGFDPRLSSGTRAEAKVELRHCPFLELAATQRDLVCGMHLGLMRGALDRIGAPLEATSLIPFADPHTCIAHVRTKK